MQNSTESVDFLLRLLEEDSDMLKGIFRGPTGLAQNRMPIFGLDNWSDEKRAILERLMKREFVKLAVLRPDEQDFSMWLLTRRSEDSTEKNLSELRDEFLGLETVPVLSLTEDGQRFLAG